MSAALACGDKHNTVTSPYRAGVYSDFAKYAVTGEVLEWTESGEQPLAILMVLQVIGLNSGDVKWELNGLRTASPAEDEYDLSRQLVIELINAMPMYN